MKSQKIVIVDDNNDNLLLTSKMLEKGGYEVRTLHESQNIVEFVKSFRPGLIFMDHDMPARNGVAVTRLLKSDQECNHIPVIYFTAARDILELAAEAGADGWLSKPFTPDDLIQKARHFLKE